MNEYQKGTISFGVGCIIFTYDAYKLKNRRLLLGCILFDIGSYYFMKDAFRFFPNTKHG